MQKIFQGKQRPLLRSKNVCHTIPNLFRNKNEKKLSKNVQFIPRHVLKKIQQRDILTCQDIIDMPGQFTPFRCATDIFTVRMALKMQQKYCKRLEVIINQENKAYFTEKSIAIDQDDQIEKQIPTQKTLQ